MWYIFYWTFVCSSSEEVYRVSFGLKMETWAICLKGPLYTMAGWLVTNVLSRKAIKNYMFKPKKKKWSSIVFARVEILFQQKEIWLEILLTKRIQCGRWLSFSPWKPANFKRNHWVFNEVCFDVNHFTIDLDHLRNNKCHVSFLDQSLNLKWESNKFKVLLFRRLARMVNLVLFALMQWNLFPKSLVFHDNILTFECIYCG